MRCDKNDAASLVMGLGEVLGPDRKDRVQQPSPVVGLDQTGKPTVVAQRVSRVFGNETVQLACAACQAGFGIDLAGAVKLR
jgi:hypothetical protein